MMPRRGAGRPRAALAKVAKTDNAIRRKALGSLTDLKVSARTANRYNNALKEFFMWVKGEPDFELPADTADFDALVQAWVEYCWQSGDGKCKAADTLGALQWQVPALKRQLNGSWTLIKAWQRHELPARAPPLARSFLCHC